MFWTLLSLALVAIYLSSYVNGVAKGDFKVNGKNIDS